MIKLQEAIQKNRGLAVSTPLGGDVLLLQKLEGHEQVSGLFQFELSLLSADGSIDPADLLGHNVSFRVRTADGSPRYFNGFVSRFGHVGEGQYGAQYTATVVPWLWFLTRTADCRIFQEKTTPEIIEQIFLDLGFTDFEISSLTAQYTPREYCVQYRETDLDFVSRLMEEEGIFYFFRHENGKHTLVLADSTAAYYDLAEKADFLTIHEEEAKRVWWRHFQEFRPGRWAQTDYNFKTPGADLMSKKPSSITLRDNGNYEVYDYPGRFEDAGGGKKLTRIRMEENDALHDVVQGGCFHRSFAPGGRFQIEKHLAPAEVGRKYVVTRVQHTASVDGSYLTGTGMGELLYANKFTCIPESVVFRSQRVTRRPIVEGPQTAVITGPPGEEIHCDEYGRVKVQFHWDREGKRDHNSSCWIRVSQIHAGQNWGAMDLPRIGEEVIVDFLEGDPDRPIISGRVYNAQNMPPFELPAGKTRRGNKTKTYKGAGFNEMSMDDTPGQEQLRMNAQHNMDSNVNNNQTLKVGVDRSGEIGNNDALKVGVDSAESVGNNKSVTVGNNMNTDVGNKLVVNAGSSITLKCGASKIYMNSGGVIQITGTIITTAAAANATVVAPLTQVIGGVMLTTIGGINMLQGAVTHVGAAGLCSVAGSKTDVTGGVTTVKGAPIKLN